MIKKELINQSIDYIIQHFDENLSIEDVADHFHFSKFYFCRSFKKVTGESVYAFIKRLKIDQSAIIYAFQLNRARIQKQSNRLFALCLPACRNWRQKHGASVPPDTAKSF